MPHFHTHVSVNIEKAIWLLINILQVYSRLYCIDFRKVWLQERSAFLSASESMMKSVKSRSSAIIFTNANWSVWFFFLCLLCFVLYLTSRSPVKWKRFYSNHWPFERCISVNQPYFYHCTSVSGKRKHSWMVYKYTHMYKIILYS